MEEPNTATSSDAPVATADAKDDMEDEEAWGDWTAHAEKPGDEQMTRRMTKLGAFGQQMQKNQRMQKITWIVTMHAANG